MYNKEITAKYLKNVDHDYQKKMGQYFTPVNIQEVLFEHLEKKDNAVVLEPSAGTGEFIEGIKKHFSNPNIISMDIDETFDTMFHADFLTYDFSNKFDYIIGNPPYFETNNIIYRNLFKDIVNGRLNIYACFIKKSIDLLKDNGYLAFVIPTSINTSKYFEKIRKYIIHNTNIEYLKSFGVNDFENAIQEVQIIILKKCSNNGNYIITIGDDKIISEKYNEAKHFFDNSYTLKDLGYKVVTGNIVWNNELLSDEGTPLIYASNIVDGQIILNNDNEKKKQYVQNKKTFNNVIVCNRIIGSKNKSLKCAIVDYDCCCENHVNVIIADNPKISLEELYNKLISKEVQESLSYITNNTQLSQYELENRLPIKI